MSYNIFLDELAEFANLLKEAGLAAYIAGCDGDYKLVVTIMYPDFMSAETAERIVRDALGRAIGFARYDIDVLPAEKHIILTIELH